jgi:hypothetical protein
LWGEPDKRTRKELRWNGGDAYSVRTYAISKHVWYDHGAERSGSTLDLVDYHKGRPKRDLRGAVFFEVWREANALGIVPEPAPAPKKVSDNWPPIRAIYPYHDENNVLLYEIVRFDTDDPDLRFRPRRPDGKGNWIYDLDGVRRVLYRLSELIEGIASGYLVLNCEGESDVETARGLGYIATTNEGGIGKWRDEYDEYFRGADVVVISDNDVHGKGQAYAEERAQRLSRVAKRVRKIMFEVKDLRAWVEAGGTREQLDTMIERALDWTPQPKPATVHKHHAEPEAHQLPELIINGSDPTATAKDLAALIAKRDDFLFNGHAPIRIAAEADCLPRALEVTTEMVRVLAHEISRPTKELITRNVTTRVPGCAGTTCSPIAPGFPARFEAQTDHNRARCHVSCCRVDREG